MNTPLVLAPKPPVPAGRLWVFYDGACGVCSGATAWALSMDRGGRLHAEPAQSRSARERLGPLADTRALEELHVWSEARGTESGVDAIAAILRELPGGARWARALVHPRVRPLTERAYRWFATRRLIFGASSCEVSAAKR